MTRTRTECFWPTMIGDLGQGHRVNLPQWVRIYRVVLGALALWAVYQNRLDQPDDEHFYQFFTNQSNIIAGIVLILGGTLFAGRRPPLPWEYLRGAAVMTMVTTGVVYALLLGGLYNPFGPAHPWMDSVLHQLIPVVMVLDLLIVPLSRRVSWWGLLVFSIYPLLYLGYAIWNGARTGWYPYNFLDPGRNGGAVGVALTVILLMIGFLMLSALVIVFSRMASDAPGPEPVPETSPS
jgi:hypothetical protein